MKKNLRNRIALIFAFLLVCLYGIFGIPQGVTGKAILDAMTKRIHLGLDLQGGVHLVLQVQGCGSSQRRDRQHRAARVRQELQKANITFLAGLSSPIRTSRS